MVVHVLQHHERFLLRRVWIIHSCKRDDRHWNWQGHLLRALTGEELHAPRDVRGPCPVGSHSPGGQILLSCHDPHIQEASWRYRSRSITTVPCPIQRLFAFITAFLAGEDWLQMLLSANGRWGTVGGVWNFSLSPAVIRAHWRPSVLHTDLHNSGHNQPRSGSEAKKDPHDDTHQWSSGPEPHREVTHTQQSLKQTCACWSQMTKDCDYLTSAKCARVHVARPEGECCPVIREVNMFQM